MMHTAQTDYWLCQKLL